MEHFSSKVFMHHLDTAIVFFGSFDFLNQFFWKHQHHDEVILFKSIYAALFQYLDTAIVFLVLLTFETIFSESIDKHLVFFVNVICANSFVFHLDNDIVFF